RGRGRAAALQGRGLVQELVPRREGKTILRVHVIACTTWRATFRALTLANDRSRNRPIPTGHFAARQQATCNARKIRRRPQLTRNTMVQSGAPSGKAAEKSGRTGSAWRNTTRQR